MIRQRPRLLVKPAPAGVGAGLRDDRSEAEIVGKTRPYRFNTSNSGLP